MKKCKKCGLEKDVSNFNNRKKSKDGLDYTCKECVSEFNKKYSWDIDHIVPLSTATTEEDLIRLNHYTNLQPLCSKVNRDIKRDKQNYEV